MNSFGHIMIVSMAYIYSEHLNTHYFFPKSLKPSQVQNELTSFTSSLQNRSSH
jgi:hypothetical protein